MPGITDPTEAYFKDGAWGWDGTRWRKLSLIWGFTSRYVEEETGTASGAGDAYANMTAVPDGYVFMLQGANAVHYAGVAKETRIRIIAAGVPFELLIDKTLASSTWVQWVGQLALAKDDYVQAITYAPGDTKTNAIHVWGYMMAIAE